MLAYSLSFNALIDSNFHKLCEEHMIYSAGTSSLSPQKSPTDRSVTADGVDTLFKGLELIHSTTRQLCELRAAAKESGVVALGAIELISALGNHAGLGDIRETLIIAQHAIENLSRCNEREGG